MKVLTGDNDPVLRAVSAPVPADQLRKYKRLAADMVAYVRDPKNASCGLAAPQVGKNVRVVAVTPLRTWDDEDAPTMAMFNPEIVEKSTELTTEQEGCLSLPGCAGLVTRHARIAVTWQDAAGARYRRTFEGVAARIVQHELDHLDGILFMDKAVPVTPPAAHGTAA